MGREQIKKKKKRKKRDYSEELQPIPWKNTNAKRVLKEIEEASEEFDQTMHKIQDI